MPSNLKSHPPDSHLNPVLLKYLDWLTCINQKKLGQHYACWNQFWIRNTDVAWKTSNRKPSHKGSCSLTTFLGKNRIQLMLHTFKCSFCIHWAPVIPGLQLCWPFKEGLHKTAGTSSSSHTKGHTRQGVRDKLVSLFWNDSINIIFLFFFLVFARLCAISACLWHILISCINLSFSLNEITLSEARYFYTNKIAISVKEESLKNSLDEEKS